MFRGKSELEDTGWTIVLRVTVEIFISWSGEQSEQVAAVLHRFIPLVIPGADIFVSEQDIGPGTRWSRALAEKLDHSDVGIFVVTPSNLDSRWLNFEAGAIAKKLERARVVPLLFDIKRGELTGPLAEFQALEWSKHAALELSKVINQATESTVGSIDLSARVDEHWPDLDRQVAAIPGISSTTPLRFLLWDTGLGESIRLVFPRFIFDPQLGNRLRRESAKLSPEAQGELDNLLDSAKFSRLFGTPGQREGGQGVDDIRPFAMNDLRALCTIAQSLGKEGARFQPVPDNDLRQNEGHFSLVIFGLTTNRFTKIFLESSRLKGNTPLFAEDESGGMPAVRLANGEILTYEDDNYGLIARVTPPNQDTKRKWLICAGLGPTGTEAAANYLCNNGKELARTVGTQDFVKVVRCTSGLPESYDSNPRDTVFADGSSPII